MTGPHTNLCTRTPYDHGPLKPVADPSNRLVYGITRYRGAATIAAYIQYPDGHLLSLRPPGGCVRRPAGPRRVRAFCGRARALRSPLDLAMAPDGSNLYVLTHGSEVVSDGGVVVLRRRADGTIYQPGGRVGCITQQARAGCAPGRSMDKGRRLALSLDGDSLYVTSQTGGVAVLRRAPKGGLSQAAGEAGCLLSAFKPVGSSCARVPVPDAVPVDVLVAPDGAFVYVLMSRREVGAIAVYARDARTGALTFASCVAENGGEAPCSAATGLAGGRALAVSPDGRSVYAAGQHYQDGGTLVTFARDATHGTLTPIDDPAGCLAAVPRPGCSLGPPFVTPTSMGASRDGAAVYVVYRNDTTGTGQGGILAEFVRGSSSGELGYSACAHRDREGCNRVRGVYGFARLTISVDGRYMYLGGRRGTAIFRL